MRRESDLHSGQLPHDPAEVILEPVVADEPALHAWSGEEGAVIEKLLKVYYICWVVQWE